MQLMSNVRRHMRVPFAIGFATPGTLGFAVISFIGKGGSLPVLVGLSLVLVACLVASGGFEIGRSTNPISAAPIASRWRTFAVMAIGASASIVCLPVGFFVFARLSGTGVWQPIATFLWFSCSGIACGWAYGPAFRRVALRFPLLREGERAV
jgi:hypothetical protein